MNLYVGNLPYTMDEEELRSLFEQFGTVGSARLIRDRDTDRPRGFGFVEMLVAAEAEKAIQGLDGRELHGRNLVVNEARPKADARGARTERRW